MIESRRTTALIAAAMAAILTPAALLPIRSYDFFWHLASGRWIVEHGGFPRFDPFSVGSDHRPWINGEWLFQVPLYTLHSIEAIAWTRAAGVAILFAAVFYFATRSCGRPLALLLTALAFSGAYERLDARPSTVAAALAALAILLLQRDDRRDAIGFVILTIVWINIHPSALLAPLLALAARRLHWLPVASTAALLINPFGLQAITAPIELTRFARSGAFVNSEWLPSSPLSFPMLYVTVGIGAVIFATGRDSSWRAVCFAAFGYLAIAHVRNQGLYFAVFPLLVAPALGSLPLRHQLASRRFSAGAPYFLAIGLAGFTCLRDHHVAELAPHRYPIEAVRRLKSLGLAGNVYNPDQFGGYLIWELYPERRVLTDGRNELYHTLLPEYAQARLNSRAWRKLLNHYHIDLAVDEYRPLLDTVNPQNGEHTAVPASLAYWPRREWALIAFDEVGMVFARRAAFGDSITALEIKGVIPDAPRRR